MADENQQASVQPNASTGDIIGAMRAQQASMTSLYQLSQMQYDMMGSIAAIQELELSELKKQTQLLTRLYEYITRKWGPSVAANQQQLQNGGDGETTSSNALGGTSRSFAERQYDTLQAMHENARLSGNLIADNLMTSLWESLVPRLRSAREDIPLLNNANNSYQSQVGVDVALAQELELFRDGLNQAYKLWEEFENYSRKSRDDIIRKGFDKIEQDVKDMSTYALDIYQTSADKIYSAWDKNLGQVSATMGYTKEAINTLQDQVAQRLQAEGYSTSINAADFLDELSRVLNANLNDTLAEAFATQSLILEKAVPEIDLTSMAAEFGAIYTGAQREGKDAESVMIEAMNQVAGAVKAIEETTDGNNQFIRQVPAYLQQAQTIVARAGGSVDNVAALTTQMMAAEGPLAALAPQLSGFTGELINILTQQNDSTAVALRAIMHDINSEIGISATDFMTSFMEDTQGTLVTAFEAIDQFIERNESPAARQEFLTAMESIFGISGDKLAQLDFGYLSEQLAQTNASMNTSALLEAEALVQSGETTTLEEQLVANTSNMLLAQNSIRDTLDNAIMRKLEKNEIQMERSIRMSMQTQVVNFAEETMSFFTKLKDIMVDLLDPLGIFKMANSAISIATETAMEAAEYSMVASWSSIGSEVASDFSADMATAVNTVGGAAAAIAAAEISDGDALVMEAALDLVSNAGSTVEMYAKHQDALAQNQTVALANILAAQQETTVGNYDALTQQQQQQQADQDAKDEEQKRLQEEAATENRNRALESAQRDTENHDNLVALNAQMPELRQDIQSFHDSYLTQDTDSTISVIESIAIFRDTYVSSISDIRTDMATMRENGFNSVVAAIVGNKPDTTKLNDIHTGVERIITLFSTYLEFLDQSLQESSSSTGLRMSPSDKAQITGRGLLY